MARDLLRNLQPSCRYTTVRKGKLREPGCEDWGPLILPASKSLRESPLLISRAEREGDFASCATAHSIF